MSKNRLCRQRRSRKESRSSSRYSPILFSTGYGCVCVCPEVALDAVVYDFCDRRQVTSYVPFTKRLPMVEEVYTGRKRRPAETLAETAEEWSEEQAGEPLSDADRDAIETEVADLDAFAKLATSIEESAKGKALVKALTVAFAKAAELRAAQKATIFTESRKNAELPAPRAGRQSIQGRH
jgi:hypothetical protein